MSVQLLHAGCVAIQGRGLLIRGRSGSGKSDLALRLVDRGHILVADDYVELHNAGRALAVQAPALIGGKIEVRGVGIVNREAGGPVRVALILDLDRPPERLPEPAIETVLGIDLPVLGFAPFEASAAIKVEVALKLHGLSLD